MGRKGGLAAGKASKFCRGKKGRAFQACRRAYFRRTPTKREIEAYYKREARSKR